MKGFCYCFSPKGFAFPAKAGRGLASARCERSRLIGWAEGGRPQHPRQRPGRTEPRGWEGAAPGPVGVRSRDERAKRPAARGLPALPGPLRPRGLVCANKDRPLEEGRDPRGGAAFPLHHAGRAAQHNTQTHSEPNSPSQNRIRGKVWSERRKGPEAINQSLVIRGYRLKLSQRLNCSCNLHTKTIPICYSEKATGAGFLSKYK